MADGLLQRKPWGAERSPRTCLTSLPRKSPACPGRGRPLAKRRRESAPGRLRGPPEHPAGRGDASPGRALLSLPFSAPLHLYLRGHRLLHHLLYLYLYPFTACLSGQGGTGCVQGRRRREDKRAQYFCLEDALHPLPLNFPCCLFSCCCLLCLIVHPLLYPSETK